MVFENDKATHHGLVVYLWPFNNDNFIRVLSEGKLLALQTLNATIGAN